MIAILGGHGFIGGYFQARLRSEGEPFLVLGRRDVDCYDPLALSEFLRQRDVSFLINCAGFTGTPNVDACENDPRACLRANAVLPRVVREACERIDLPWGHVSSGCLYLGDGPPGGFSESDPPNFSFRQNNCSFYSGSKALGEEALTGASQCYVWRLRMPFSSVDHPRNYLSKLLRYERLLDARNSLSQLDEFVAACLQCRRERLPYGVYHLTCGGSLTTREVVDLLTSGGFTTKQFAYFSSEEEFMRTAAQAPRSHCVLNNQKALDAGLKLSPVRDAISEAIAAWRPANAQ